MPISAIICLVDDSIGWESTFEIVQILKRHHPGQSLDEVSLNTLKDWILALPQFEDDPTLVNDRILQEILIEWIEENL